MGRGAGARSQAVAAQHQQKPGASSINRRWRAVHAGEPGGQTEGQVKGTHLAGGEGAAALEHAVGRQPARQLRAAQPLLPCRPNVTACRQEAGGTHVCCARLAACTAGAKCPLLAHEAPLRVCKQAQRVGGRGEASEPNRRTKVAAVSYQGFKSCMPWPYPVSQQPGQTSRACCPPPPPAMASAAGQSSCLPRALVMREDRTSQDLQWVKG